MGMLSNHISMGLFISIQPCEWILNVVDAVGGCEDWCVGGSGETFGIKWDELYCELC